MRFLRTWGAALAYVALAAGVALVLVLGRPSWPFGDDGVKSGFVCIEDSGLPGGATGRFFYVVGKDEEPYSFDGRAYFAGDHIFSGYCGPDGKRIP